MNSSEQKDFEHFTPTADDVDCTVAMLRKKFEEEGEEQHADAGEGGREAIRILAQGKHQYADISPGLTSDAARAVAVMAVDYLNGDCSRETLLACAARLL